MTHREKPETNEAQQRRSWILLVLLLAGIIILAFVVFLRGNYQNIRDDNRIYAENTAVQTANRLDDILKNAENSIETLAKLYEKLMDSPEPDLSLLEDIADDTLFDYVEYADASGMNWMADGASADVSDRTYYQKGMQGESGIEVVWDTRITHETLVVFYTPLHYEDEIVGVLKGEYRGERLQGILEETYFGETTVSYLCEKGGAVIAQSSTGETVDSLTEFFDDDRIDAETQAGLQEAVENGLSYGYTFMGNKGRTNAYLAQLTEADWCVLQTFPSEVAAEMSSRVWKASTVLMLVLVLAFGIYIVFIMTASGRRQKSMERQKHEIQQIVDGVNRLFSRFVVVNLPENQYYYLADYSQMPSTIPRKGVYSDFVRYFNDRIIETTGEQDLREALESSWLLDHLGGDTPVLQFEFHIRRDQADRWEKAAIICLEEKDGRPANLLLAIQDVTEIKEMGEHSREVLMEALQAAQEANSAKSDFLSRMSHDIRTPMNAIMGMSSIASMHLAEPERVKDCLEKIRISGSHLLGMINEVLDFSKIESGRMSLAASPFSVRDCVSTARGMFRLQIEENGLTLETPGDEIRHDRVVGDVRRLQRILVNILSNAVKFTPAGGKITLRVREKETPVSGSVCFEFVCEDTGIGMDSEFAKHIFEPFSRERDSRFQKSTGSGLGLPISRSLVRMMDGDIAVESKQGEGSRFTVTVVLKLAPEEKSAVSVCGGTGKELPRFEGRKVLLVEDNEMNAEIAVEFLRMLGIEPDVAQNGQEAVNILLSSELCAYDLVLMDIQMPVMNGYEATRAIRSTNRADLNNLPVIAMTANAFQEDVTRSMEAGMNAHVAKPVSPAKLAKVLQDWL